MLEAVDPNERRQAKKDRVIFKGERAKAEVTKPVPSGKRFEVKGVSDNDEGTSLGHANIIVNGPEGVKFKTLTTDIPMDRAFPAINSKLGGNIRIDDVDRMFDGEPYVRVTVTDTSNNAHVFFAQGYANGVGSYEGPQGHLYLTAPDSGARNRWFGSRDIEHMLDTNETPLPSDKPLLLGSPTASYELTQDDKDYIGHIAQNMLRAMGKGFDNREAAKKPVDLLPRPELDSSGMWGAADKNYSSFRAFKHKDKAGNEGAAYAYYAHGPLIDIDHTIADIPPGLHGIVNSEWLITRPMEPETRKTYKNAVLDAVSRFMRNNGAVFGFYRDDQNHILPGMKVFLSGKPDTAALLPSLNTYIMDMAKAEAAYYDGDYSKIYKDTVDRLRHAYEKTRDIHNTGMVGVSQLVNIEARTDRLSGTVIVTPTLLHIVADDMKRSHSHRGDMRDLTETFVAEANRADGMVEELVKQEAERVIAGHEKHGQRLSSFITNFVEIAKAYDSSNVDAVKEDAPGIYMRNWTQLTARTGVDYKYLMLPPSTTYEQYEEIRKLHPGYAGSFRNITDQTLEKFATFVFRDGLGNKDVNIYSPKTGRIDYTPGVVAAAAVKYQTDTDSEAALKREAFGFDPYRPGKPSTPELRASENLTNYLKSLRTSPVDKYRSTTDMMASLYRQIFHDARDNSAVAETLSRLNEITLKDSAGQKMTVVFGPSGALYKVGGYAADGSKRRMIEEIPVRAFDPHSKYMDVLSRLHDAANGVGDWDSRLRFSDGSNLFGEERMYGSTTHRDTFNQWYNDLTKHIAEINGRLQMSDLRGFGIYSRLIDLTGSEALAGGGTGGTRGEQIKARDEERLRRKFVVDTSSDVARHKIARETHDALVMHLKGYYGSIEANSAAFREKYAVDDATARKLEEAMTNQMNRYAQRLNENISAWRDMEHLFEVTIAQEDPDNIVVNSLLELERRERGPSIISRAVDALSGVIAKIYRKFVDSFKTVFDLMNPLTIINNLGAAFTDTIHDTVRMFMSQLFTGFMDRHFAAAPNVKEFMAAQLEDMDVKYLRAHERKVINTITGNTFVTPKTEHQMIKQHRLNAALKIKPMWNTMSPSEQAVVTRAFNPPELAASKNEKYDSDRYHIVYHVKSEDAFARLGEEFGYGKLPFESLRNKSGLREWWNKVGHNILPPASLEDTSGNDHAKTVWKHFMDGLPEEQIHVDGRNIVINMNVRHIPGFTPESIYGTGKSARKAIRSLSDEQVKAELTKRNKAGTNQGDTFFKLGRTLEDMANKNKGYEPEMTAEDRDANTDNDTPGGRMRVRYTRDGKSAADHLKDYYK